MQITDRQKEILDSVVAEYISSAEPVSSQLIEKDYDFGICPATIRSEMQKLTEGGFLYQPHTSAGRVPTDKGYRFYVDELLKKEFPEEINFGIDELIKGEIKDTFRLLSLITKNLATISSNLALSYLPAEKILWKEGWEEILQEPEFKEEKIVASFAAFLKSIEDGFECHKFSPGINIYIGRENPLPKAREFSLIISQCHFPEEKKGILAIAGPKRMTYEKNIYSLNSLIKLLEKI
jgi:transcriptional regulator of heat shock response